ncbi:MAG TPA: adenylate/guanylate cyclase domain-containing protein [Acidimicrobiales bacterium]|nr:adenylate/guanylate cyclase domain-containing protein [Acidimicrobiales bacterium]
MSASRGGGRPTGPPSRCVDLPPDELAELRQWLVSQGATDEQLDAAGDDLDRVAPELALARDERLSARAIAEQQGRDPGRVVQVFRMFGVAVPDIDRVRFTDLDALLVASVEEAGIVGSSDGQGFMRVVASGLDRVAEAAVALYVQGTEVKLAEQGASALAFAQETARMTHLAGNMGEGMGVLFRHHLRQAIDRQRVSQEGVASRDVARIAVGFVDLVGSTARTAALDVGELRAVVNEFEARAWEVATEFGGRVVKFIGDEIMVAALDPVAGCHLLLALVEACSVGDMQPRGGLAYGEVLFRGGDYYGREVNLASRLVDAAIPGEVLVDGSVFDAVKATSPHAVAFEPAGRRVLKGFADPLAVWSVAHP